MNRRINSCSFYDWFLLTHFSELQAASDWFWRTQRIAQSQILVQQLVRTSVIPVLRNYNQLWRLRVERWGYYSPCSKVSSLSAEFDPFCSSSAHHYNLTLSVVKCLSAVKLKLYCLDDFFSVSKLLHNLFIPLSQVLKTWCCQCWIVLMLYRV